MLGHGQLLTGLFCKLNLIFTQFFVPHRNLPKMPEPWRRNGLILTVEHFGGQAVYG